MIYEVCMANVSLGTIGTVHVIVREGLQPMLLPWAMRLNSWIYISVLVCPFSIVLNWHWTENHGGLQSNVLVTRL